MKKNLFALLLCLALVLSAFAAQASSVAVTDMYGREISMDEPASRIVALTANGCEILCAIGGESLLVGRGAYCDYPESILSLPAVQSGADTNIEEILALNPQLVLMSDMDQDKEVVDMLEANGITVAVTKDTDIEGVYTAIELVGRLAGLEDNAAALIEDMKEAFAQIKESSKAQGKTVYFEVSPLQYGLWTAGSNTFMNELAQLCGLTNAFADVEGWAAISEEQVLARDPDYIVTITMYFGEGPTPVEEIMARPGWQQLKAVKEGRILNADSNAISRPGPRLKIAAQELGAFVNEEK